MINSIPDYVVHSDTEIKGFFGKYRFLSNFHPATIFFLNISYPSSENCYQAQKIHKDLRPLFTSITPGKSKDKWKELGSIYTKEEWDNNKLQLMTVIVFLKFSQNPKLRQELLNTENRYLEETNSWGDSFYGVNCKTGIGENHLGKILMNVRKFLK